MSIRSVFRVILKFCTYKSTHPSGFWYAGKGITARVENGQYKGSGVKFKVTCMHPGFEFDTWTTVVLERFATEEEAFAAEEILVPLEALIDPYCLNIQKGGIKGRGCNHSLVLRYWNATRRKEAKAIKAAKRRVAKETAKARQSKINAKYRALQKQLKDLK